MASTIKYVGIVVLGIHSNVAGDANGFTSGHAWVSVTASNRTSFYGLWPDAHPRASDNGAGSDVRINLESGSRSAASRYYRLTPGQTMRLNFLLNRTAAWNYTNNCSSWATELVVGVLGEDVDADDWVGLETPRELGASILRLEAKQRTSPLQPTLVKPAPRTSSVRVGVR